MELKLFECRILWDNSQKGISRFTLLHVDKASAEKTIYVRLGELGPTDISKMVITELDGPFEAGDIIHQELRYRSPSEFSKGL